MKDIKEIRIDPRCMINYASFYLHGMKELGYRADFVQLDGIALHEMEDYRRGFGLEVVCADGRIKKAYVDINDRNNIHERFYEWADVYAKINLRHEDLARKKTFAIGPSFGITLWNPLTTFFMALKNYSKCKGEGYKIPLKRYVLDYLYTVVRRRPYKEYDCECEEDNDYMFTLSTLWYSEGAFRTTNVYRGAFARACKNLFPKFEGGFYYIDGETPLKECPRYPEYLEMYGDMIIHERISMKAYMKKTKRSAFVFNTPSVVGCHGWKLAEYLAMGKAMISTPHLNVMPGMFEKDRHYIEALDADEIDNAVARLRETQLEQISPLDLAQRCYQAQFGDEMSPALVQRFEKAEQALQES